MVGVVLTAFLVSQATAARTRTFSDRTDEVGLATERTDSWGALWADHDSDGYPDLFIGRHGGNPYFFTGSSDGYDRRRLNFNLPQGYDPMDDERWTDRHGCAWGEATGDGGVDLYCTVGANEGTSVGPNQLLVFTEGGLRERGRHYKVRDPYGRGRSVNWLDYDSDGDLDIFVANFDRAGHPNVLFENKRGVFRQRDAGLRDVLRSYSSTWADWDSDGDPDLLVMQYNAGAIAYENRSGRFARTTLRGISGVAWRSAAWGDFNGDGWPDVHMVNEEHAIVLANRKGTFHAVDERALDQGRASAWLDVENDGDLDLFVVQGAPGIYQSSEAVDRPDFMLVRGAKGFTKHSRAAFRGPTGGNGDSVAVADSDRDGALDVFVTNGYFEYQKWVGRNVYLENRSQVAGWIALDLNGSRWNPWGYGARLEVRTSDLRYRRELTDGVAFRAQSEVGHVHLGIGSAGAASVRIVWPDGIEDCLTVLRNTRAVVNRGTHSCPD